MTPHDDAKTGPVIDQAGTKMIGARPNPIATMGCLLLILGMIVTLLFLGCLKGCEIVGDTYHKHILQRAAK